MALNIVIMAAGKGTRMKSATPKVLHKLAGRSLLAHVLKSGEPLAAEARIVITGHGVRAGRSGRRGAKACQLRSPNAAARHRPRHPSRWCLR